MVCVSSSDWFSYLPSELPSCKVNAIAQHTVEEKRGACVYVCMGTLCMITKVFEDNIPQKTLKGIEMFIIFRCIIIISLLPLSRTWVVNMQHTSCTEDRIQHALDRCLDGLRQSPTAAHHWNGKILQFYQGLIGSPLRSGCKRRL